MFFLKLPHMKNPRNEQSIETILNCPPEWAQAYDATISGIV